MTNQARNAPHPGQEVHDVADEEDRDREDEAEAGLGPAVALLGRADEQADRVPGVRVAGEGRVAVREQVEVARDVGHVPHVARHEVVERRRIAPGEDQGEPGEDDGDRGADAPQPQHDEVREDEQAAEEGREPAARLDVVGLEEGGVRAHAPIVAARARGRGETFTRPGRASPGAAGVSPGAGRPSPCRRRRRPCP